MVDIDKLNRDLLKEIERVNREVFNRELNPNIKNAFDKVKRHYFIEDLYDWDEEKDRWEHYKLDFENPDEKILQKIYIDRPVVIALRNNEVFSTSSQPSLMAYMINIANIKMGDRVLEIGTGSGYNSAIISEIVGEENVTTKELNSINRIKRISFLFYLSIMDNDAFYFLPQSNELQEGYGIWKKSLPGGLVIINREGILHWGDKSVLERLIKHYEDFKKKGITFRDYKVEAFTGEIEKHYPDEVVVKKKFNTFVYHL